LNPAQDRGKYKWVNKMINRVGPLQELGAHQLLAILRKATHTKSELSAEGVQSNYHMSHP
jgi:hypothetical protein